MVDVGAAPIDRYVVLEHLSEGGMGAIYVGKKLGAGGFEMKVVLKQLLPEFTQQEEFIDLFLREAKLSATLDHANIVHTIDLVTAGNEYFIVMEYLAGGDLRTLLKKAKRRGKRFSPSASIHICREVLSALAYAHVKRDLEGTPLKLIHRDVSPSNILVSYAGEVKLTDFGIAKAATHNSLFYKVKGKIGYMSPEQAKSEPIDHRSDLYSLAVCMYEALTGERLFVHAGLTTSADEIYSQQVPQVSRKVPGLTTDLDAIMNKALALSPDDRYQTAGEFQEALTRCAHRNGLLMSAPEVALELLDCCGEPEQWRDDGEDDDMPYVQRAPTEVLNSGVEEEADGEADDGDARASAPAMARPSGMAGPVHNPVPGMVRPAPGMAGPVHGLVRPAPGMASPTHGMARPAPALASPAHGMPVPSVRPSSSRISRPPKTEQHKLQGVVELTSIINLIDLENQHRESMGERLLDSRPVPAMQPMQGMHAPMHLPASETRSLPGGQAMQPRMQPQGLTGQPPARGPEQMIRPESAIQRDATPTVPRPMRHAAPQPKQVPHFPAPVHHGTALRKKSFLQSWMVIIAILLAAAVAGVVVAMSGPDVAVQHGK
jgi:serine/threonine protein kinase